MKFAVFIELTHRNAIGAEAAADERNREESETKWDTDGDLFIECRITFFLFPQWYIIFCVVCHVCCVYNICSWGYGAVTLLKRAFFTQQDSSSYLREALFFVWFFRAFSVTSIICILVIRDFLSVFILCIYDSIAGHSHSVTIHSRMYVFIFAL